MEQSGVGYLGWLIPDATRQRRRYRGSLLTKRCQLNGDWSWVYDAIDIESRMVLDVALFGRHGTDPAAAFLQKLREKHDLYGAEFLVDQFGYRTSLSRVGLSGRVNYIDRNLIETWFHGAVQTDEE